MNRICSLSAICLTLILTANHASSAGAKPLDADALVKLSPRISLEQKNISTFEVAGTLDANGVQMRFIVLGKQPDQMAIAILDAHDNTPILLSVGNSFMLYDPIASEVVTGPALSTFALLVERETDSDSRPDPQSQKVVLKFSFHSRQKEKKKDEIKPTIIDIRSFLTSLVPPLEVTTEDNEHFLVSGFTAKGNMAKAYITPSQTNSPCTRMELYQAGSKTAFLVLDRISLNQPLPETHFTFPNKQLISSGLPIREISADGSIMTVLSMGRILRVAMSRLAMAGVDSPELRSTLEKMSMKKLDWGELKKNDKKAGAILRSIFQEKAADQQ